MGNGSGRKMLQVSFRTDEIADGHAFLTLPLLLGWDALFYALRHSVLLLCPKILRCTSYDDDQVYRNC